jgi:hypothetical protein
MASAALYVRRSCDHRQNFDFDEALKNSNRSIVLYFMVQVKTEVPHLQNTQFLDFSFM